MLIALHKVEESFSVNNVILWEW